MQHMQRKERGPWKRVEEERRIRRAQEMKEAPRDSPLIFLILFSL